MFNRLATFEQDFADWRRDGCPPAKPEIYQSVGRVSSASSAGLMCRQLETGRSDSAS